MVKIIVGNIDSKIIGILPDKVHSDLSETLSYKVANARFMPQVKNGHWDGTVNLYFKYKGQSFYTGLLSLVREVLDKNKIPFEIVDGRERPVQNYPELQFTGPPNYEIRDYQEFTISRSLRFTRGVLSVCTGGGKTTIVSKLIGQIKTYPFLFYVLTKDLMEQAYGELSKYLNQPIGMIGDGKCDIQKITVCTIQTAIMALNEGNSKFKINDYYFDDEDRWDEKGIESAEKADRIKTLIRQAKGIYVDECISGDAKVLTENGEVTIEESVKNKCRFVQTYDGNNIVYKRILNRWDSGIRKVFKIQLENGKKIKCTGNHVIFTKRGWVREAEILKTDEVFFASVGEEKGLHPVCNTKWQRVKNISIAGKERVYDIEVEDTHCFFANGILVHNCHHAAARTVKEVVLGSPYAYWRYGGSATPYRESGDDIMIQAAFGSKIVDISASYLIKRNWLVKPHIFFEPVITQCDFHSYAKVYEHCVVKNNSFNDHVASTANHLISRGLSVLVLVKQYPHGDYLKKLIPNSEFITSRLTSTKRTEIIDAIRNKKIMCMIATSLADEGLDIPSLDAALLAGGGKSSTRLHQRIGRTLRKDKEGQKNKSIVVVYSHNAKYLSKHVKRVKSLLKTESEFVIMDSKGANFINYEIDSVLGIKSEPPSLFK